VGLSLLILAVFLGACGPLDLGGDARRQKMLEEALLSLQQQDFETAYYRAKEIRTEYPGSDESEDAFSIAARALKRLYYRHRFEDPDSVWLNSEQEFVFEWLAGFFEDEELAGSRANSVFGGVPYGMFRSFERYAAGHPIFSRWEIRAEDDNGIIEKVTVRRPESTST
jgi:hypothetical protein